MAITRALAIAAFWSYSYCFASFIDARLPSVGMPPLSIYCSSFSIYDSKLSIFLFFNTISASAILRRCFNSFTESSLFTLALFLICFARWPNLRVDMVSCWLNMLGLQVIIRAVFELPPRVSYNICVSLESLYGMWVDLPSVSLKMTRPRVVRLLLMFWASLSPTPDTPVLLSRSEPARSTR